MDRWRDRAHRGTPVIDGETATFIWPVVAGSRVPQLIGDWTNWEVGTPASLVEAEPGVWTYTLTLPRDAYLEYSFWQDGERLPDPLNPRTTPDGLGNTNHFFYMPGAGPTPLTQRRRGVPCGMVTRHLVPHHFLWVGGKRRVDLYRPAAAGPVPLLIVLDGQDYRPRGRIVQIVDNLIGQGRIQPIALALVEHGRAARAIEYSCSEAHLAALTECVVPLAQAELPLVDVAAHPGAFGILGASMGGLMALFAGLRAPHLFGAVLAQSSALDFGGGEGLIWDLVRYGATRPLRIWMDVGRYEWLLDSNRRMVPLLRDKGYAVTYHEYSGGHNYTSWRNDLPAGLEALFGCAGQPAPVPG